MDVNGFAMVNPGAPERLGIGYFGAQGTHAMKLLEHLDGAKRYVDLTAGGMGTPYRICYKKKLPVAVNDIGFFSHACGCAIFLQQELHDEAYWREKLVAAKDMAQPGMIAEMLAWEWLGSDAVPRALPAETVAYLDGLLKILKTDDAPDLLYAAVGKTLLSDLTFRGLGFAAKTADNVALADITPDAMIERILKHLGYFIWKNTLLPEELKAENVVSWADASDFVEAFDGFQDTVVYMDPAWPWNTPNTQNPYFLSSTLLPCMLKQTCNPADLITLQPWEYGEKDRILGDVMHWTRTPLNKGALRVIVNTQSTNYPDPIAEVEPALKAAFKFQQYIEWKAFTALGSQTEHRFKEFAWIFEGVN